MKTATAIAISLTIIFSVLSAYGQEPHHLCGYLKRSYRDVIVALVEGMIDSRLLPEYAQELTESNRMRNSALLLTQETNRDLSPELIEKRNLLKCVNLVTSIYERESERLFRIEIEINESITGRPRQEMFELQLKLALERYDSEFNSFGS